MDLFVINLNQKNITVYYHIQFLRPNISSPFNIITDFDWTCFWESKKNIYYIFKTFYNDIVNKTQRKPCV